MDGTDFYLSTVFLSNKTLQAIFSFSVILLLNYKYEQMLSKSNTKEISSLNFACADSVQLDFFSL